MKNQNQNTVNENQTTIFEIIAPYSEPVAIGELLTPAEIDAVIKRRAILSDAATTVLAVRGEFEGISNFRKY